MGSQAVVIFIVVLKFRRRGKTEKYEKVVVKRKWILAQPSYFMLGKGRLSPRVEPGGRPPDAEETSGSQYRQRLGREVRLRAHSRYIRVKQE